MEKKWRRVIAHVDMDAFFAAIEQLHKPELRGKPVIIGADPRKGKGRGVVSTASYEARVYGVHSAMPITRAWRLCPHGIYVRPDMNRYSEYSRRVMAILEQFTPKVQAVSVDEAFLDLTGSVHFYGSVEKIGQAIKKKILDETGLTASVGIATSKSVAKIASDFEKPDGLTIVTEESLQEFLDPLTIDKIWGVGKKSVQTLQGMGIKTVADLRKFPEAFLEERLGKSGPHLYRMARGIDEREVHDRDPVKSVSNERTFHEDQYDEDVILSTLLALAEKVAGRLRKKGLRGKTIQIKLRFSDFSTFTRAKTLGHHVQLTDDIYRVSKALLEEFRGDKKPVRLIGVGVSQLSTGVGEQTSFLENADQRKADLERVMDEMKEKFGKNALTHAETLTAKEKLKRKRGS